jgi:hypothetical protein
MASQLTPLIEDRRNWACPHCYEWSRDFAVVAEELNRQKQVTVKVRREAVSAQAELMRIKPPPPPEEV